MTRDEAYATICGYLTDIFEIDPADISPQARLVEDLDLDSIDAVDMMVQIQEETGKKVTSDQFEHIKVVEDFVGLVQQLHDA